MRLEKPEVSIGREECVPDKIGRRSQMKRKMLEVKRRVSRFCGSFTGKLDKDLCILWDVVGNYSVYHDRCTQSCISATIRLYTTFKPFID